MFSHRREIKGDTGELSPSSVPLCSEQSLLHQCRAHHLRINKAASCDEALLKSLKQMPVHIKYTNRDAALLQH